MQGPVEEMGDGVVTLNGRAIGGIDIKLCSGALLRCAFALDEMQEGIAGFLGVGNLPLPAIDSKRAAVTGLAAHFGIEWGAVDHYARAFLFLNHFQNSGFGCQLFEPDKFGAGSGADAGDADDFLLLGGTGAFALLLHERLKAGRVHAQAGFAGHEFSEIERETVGIIQLEREIP